MSRSQLGAGLTGEEVSYSGTMEFGSKTKTIQISNQAQGFLRSASSSPLPAQESVNGEAGGWDGSSAEEQAGATEQLPLGRRRKRKCRVRAATLGPGQRTAAGLAVAASCPLQGLSTLRCYRESGVSAPWVLELGLSPVDKE